MSLGITQLWKARSHRTGVSGISLIPRGPPRWSRAPSAQLPLSCRWMHQVSDAAEISNPDKTTLPQGEENTDQTNDRTSHDAATNSADRPAAGEDATLQQARRTEETEQPESVDRVLNASSTREPPLSSSISDSSVPASGPNGLGSVFRRTGKRSPIQAGSDRDGRSAGNQSHTKPRGRPHQPNGELVARQRNSILVPPLVKYNLFRETMSGLNRHHRGVRRQLRLEAIRDIKGDPLPNWRTILDVLRRKTRPVRGRWQKHGRKIAISTKLAEVLLHHPDHTIWDISDRTRCHVELCTIKEGSPTRPRLLLSGDDEALEFAVDEVTQLARTHGSTTSIEGQMGSKMSQKDVPKGMSETNDDGGQVWDSFKPSQRPSNIPPFISRGKFERLPVPDEWTPRTLEKYIVAISNAKLLPGSAARLYGSGVAAKNAAFGLLLKTLDDPATSHALTTRTFKVALQAIENHGHSYRHYARDLFDIMLKRKVPLDTGVFNILLSGTDIVKDLGNFDNVLSMMIFHNCMPDIRTWVLVLQMVEDVTIRRHTIKLMYLSGLLTDPDAGKRVARALIVFDVRARQPTWTGLADFLRTEEAVYGKRWMSLSNMNKLLKELGRLGHLQDACQLLDTMFDSYSIRPSTLSIKIVVYHARLHRKTEWIIAALRVAHRHLIPLDEDIYHELFAFSQRMRRSNMMGLVWLAASVTHSTSWHMRRDVSRLTTLPGEPGIVGTAPRVKNPGGAAPIYTIPEFDKMRPTGLFSESRPRRGAAIQSLLADRYDEWTLEKPLHELLEAAWDVDNEIYNSHIKIVKQRQQQQQDAAAVDTADAVPPEREPIPQVTTTQGVPLLIRRKWYDENGKGTRRRRELAVPILHVTPGPVEAVQEPVEAVQETRQAEDQPLGERDEDIHVQQQSQCEDRL
ncbi:pentatricopeptide repeat domain-containing protein [Colletotrichum karsti]|uniref:Pentatricopeptide repeat domain-containing protein n=1 Tax=Colletotrichum karsti TaxID=1095194 RepID=A0A9P6IIQ1_9PEZI|nr:pentatricopeptide repeat domain-containing protein [Colletotrichum karsti]KAF9882096.1 pentatricopeptide repeat domain-containing protein [Colletotrichum karsti]